VIGEETDQERAQSRARLAPITQHMRAPSAEEVAGMNLDRCLRIFPHDQNTSGFFVAILRKTKALASQPSQRSRVDVAAHASMSSRSEVSLQVVKHSHASKRPSRGEAIRAMHDLGYNPKDSQAGSEINRHVVLQSVDSNVTHPILHIYPIDVAYQAGGSQEALCVIQDDVHASYSVITQRWCIALRVCGGLCKVTCLLYMHALGRAFEAARSWGRSLPILQCGFTVGRFSGEGE
jgi:hypothetical protein